RWIAGTSPGDDDTFAAFPLASLAGLIESHTQHSKRRPPNGARGGSSMVYRPKRMKFGVFIAPFHRVGENPTIALKRDMKLVELLDELGFDEAWFGEPHSYGREIIADPCLFIAAAAERTRRIKLGTGVLSLPYHHPLMVADRMVQLDHMTEGRAML